MRRPVASESPGKEAGPPLKDRNENHKPLEKDYSFTNEGDLIPPPMSRSDAFFTQTPLSLAILSFSPTESAGEDKARKAAWQIQSWLTFQKWL